MVENMTPDGTWRFRLPELDIPVRARSGRRIAIGRMRMDTILLEPDSLRVTLTLRSAFRSHRNVRPIDELRCWPRQSSVGESPTARQAVLRHGRNAWRAARCHTFRGMTPHLAIIGYGAVTAVGFDAAQTCAAVRAGVSGFRRSGFYLRRKRVTPLIGAAVQYEIPPREDSPSNRLARMASDAITECVDRAALTPGRTAILLGVREHLAASGVEGLDGSELFSSVGVICGGTFHRESALMAHSSCAIATGLVQAARLLAAGTVDACVVGGVDWYLTHEDIERYDRLARIKTPDNSRGFIPGEAAAVVAVTIDRAPFGPPCILGVGLAQEDESRTAISDGHATGRALTAALSAATRDAAVEERALAFRVADLNGEMLQCAGFYSRRTPFLSHIAPGLPFDVAGCERRGDRCGRRRARGSRGRDRHRHRLCAWSAGNV